MGSFHNSKGIEFIKADPDDDLSKSVRLLGPSQKRQGISLRNEEYFKKIRHAFGDRAVIYYARMHLDRYVESVGGADCKEAEHSENTRKLDEAKALIEEKGNTVNLAASLVIMPDPQAKLKIARLLSGSDCLCALDPLSSVGLIYAGVCDSIDAGCDYFNLGEKWRL